MQRPIFVKGEPVLSGGRGQEAWQAEIRLRATGETTHPKLTFVVSDLKRHGQLFDLDNLVHPVLMVFDDPIDSMSARLFVGSPPGLLIESGPPDPPAEEPQRSLYVPTHSRTSVRGRPGIPEIANDPVFDEHEGLGLSLTFDSDDIPIRKGWFGPTEAVIDDLSSWFGNYSQRDLIADHRIRDLRITRGRNPTANGVEIAVWYIPDEAVPVPDDVQERIETADRDPK